MANETQHKINSQTTSLIPLTSKFSQMNNGQDGNVCPDCGCELGCAYTQDGEPVLSCYTDICRDKARLKQMRENPENFLRGYKIPRKHLSCSLENYNGNQSVVKLCYEYAKRLHGSLIFSGICGSGKTHLAVGVLRILITNMLIPKNGALFTTTPELLLDIRQCFKADSNVDEIELISHYSNIAFLLLDDLGAEKASEWAINTLYLIIDRRNRNEKPTVFTTNLTLKQIANQLGSRIASRLSDCQVIKINMPDYRKLRK